MVRRMAKSYRCPACQNEVEQAATICSNPACRRELAYCSHCRDVSTYTLVEKREGRLARDRYRCDRCDRLGVKCATWLMGAYCNGLARAGEHAFTPLCAACLEHVGSVGKNAVVYAIMGALSGLLKRKK